MDTIAEAQVENLTDNLYNYKERLPIPPLGMVDDQINVTYCGLDSALTTYQNSLLLSSRLSNSETWYNLSMREINWKARKDSFSPLQDTT